MATSATIYVKQMKEIFSPSATLAPLLSLTAKTPFLMLQNRKNVIFCLSKQSSSLAPSLLLPNTSHTKILLHIPNNSSFLTVGLILYKIGEGTQSSDRDFLYSTCSHYTSRDPWSLSKSRHVKSAKDAHILFLCKLKSSDFPNVNGWCLGDAAN